MASNGTGGMSDKDKPKIENAPSNQENITRETTADHADETISGNIQNSDGSGNEDSGQVSPEANSRGDSGGDIGITDNTKTSEDSVADPNKTTQAIPDGESNEPTDHSLKNVNEDERELRKSGQQRDPPPPSTEAVEAVEDNITSDSIPQAGNLESREDHKNSGDNSQPIETPSRNSEVVQLFGEVIKLLKSTIQEKGLNRTNDSTLQKEENLDRNTDDTEIKQKLGDVINLFKSSDNTGSKVDKQTPDTKRNFSKLFSEGVEKVYRFYKSDFAIFMFYTTLSAFFGGVLGAFLIVHGPKFISLDNGTAPPTTTVTACPATTISQQTPVDHQPDITKLTTSLEQCLAGQETDQILIGNLTIDVERLNGSVRSLKNDLTSVQSETEKNYTMLTQDLKLKNYVVEAQMTALKEVFVSKEWLFIILLMGLFEIAVIGVVWVMWQKLTDNLRQKLRGRSQGSHVTGSVANGRPSLSGGGGIQGDLKVLRNVHPITLNDRVCVVSFHSETVSYHIAKVKAILAKNEATKRVNVVQFLISKHDDILMMPPSKLYLVFVDFNERNVILEDPDKGLGDLRLTTVQAIDRMRADVILTYSDDKGSNRLSSGDLYNPDLSSIRQHSELRRLDSAQRMLSVFENFNKTQIDHITKVVKDVVK